MERVLRALGDEVARERAVRVFFQGEEIAFQRLDMVNDERVVVEVKASAVLPPTASQQLLNYLRATNLEVGLLSHFGPKARFQRIVAFNSKKYRSDRQNPIDPLLRDSAETPAPTTQGAAQT